MYPTFNPDSRAPFYALCAAVAEYGPMPATALATADDDNFAQHPRLIANLSRSIAARLACRIDPDWEWEEGWQANAVSRAASIVWRHVMSADEPDPGYGWYAPPPDPRPAIARELRRRGFTHWADQPEALAEVIAARTSSRWTYLHFGGVL